MKIHYEPHPVTPERKKELVSKGLKIVDARFDPERKPSLNSVIASRESIGAMRKAEVLEMLEAHGVEDTGESVAKLREKLIKIMFVED